MTLVTDRTTIETDWDCGMRRWWYKHAEGGGIVPVTEPVYYRDGRNTHADLAAIASGESLDSVLARISDPEPDAVQEEMESWARRIGWAVAFAEYLWPRLEKGYDFVMAEKEMVLDRGDLWIAFTADLIIRNKRTKKLVVVDFKSVGMMTRAWTEHWPHAVQMHINAVGVEEELGEKVSHSQVIGLMKGMSRDGKLRHPYVWAYSNGDKWQSEYKYGWNLRPVWEYGSGGKEGIVEWVRALGDGPAMAQFPFSEPIVPDGELLKDLIAQVAEREQEVSIVLHRATDDRAIRRRHFPPRYSKCVPAVGAACPYVAACFNRDVGDDPIGSGLYVNRTPHHDVEFEGEW